MSEPNTSLLRHSIYSVILSVMLFLENLRHHGAHMLPSDLVLSVGVCVISILLKLAEIHTKFRKSIHLWAAFLFFHFIAFPWLYVFALAANPKSFEFDKTIFNNEKLNSIGAFNYRSLISLDSMNIAVGNNIINSKSPILDSNLKALGRDFAIVDSFYLLVQFSPSDERVPEFSLVVRNANGKLVTYYQNKVDQGDSGISLRTFFKKSINDAHKAFAEEKLKRDKITQDMFWTYDRILPYSINIFTTSNIAPKTVIANIIWFAHYLIVWGVLLTILMGLVIAEIQRKKTNLPNGGSNNVIIDQS